MFWVNLTYVDSMNKISIIYKDPKDSYTASVYMNPVLSVSHILCILIRVSAQKCQ